MGKKKIATLFQKTLVGQIVLFGVVALTTSAFSGWNLNRQLRREYRSKGSAIATSVAYYSENLIASSPAETTQSVIDEFLEIQGVAYVFVVDVNRDIIAHTFVPQVPKELQLLQNVDDFETIVIREIDIKNLGDFTNISAPILAGVGGYVHVGMDRGLIRGQIARAMQEQIFLIFLLFILSGIATYLMVKKVSQPLDRLTEYAQKLARHDFDAIVDVKSKGEIGLLATTMQKMARELSRFIQRLEAAVNELNQTLQALREEQEKSERLLLNILPIPIARKLKEKPTHIADGFPEVTILFADIVGFTKLSQKISPQEIVQLLNDIFCAFDNLSDRHGLEKIKTIGDAYMAVGGLPVPREDHAEAVAEMALDMQRELRRISVERGENFSIRIGVNTGPVVAGVIGTKKFIYDLWGDAVNTASRMESHGIADCIQLTDSTYNILQNKYRFKERGVIHVKGKGDMTTYLLLGRKSDNEDKEARGQEEECRV
ncbi:MAG: HAMP domain-containing protein [Oscillatoria sp. SIO1A7]|nr:HAMP domain-containing protein [Oscillatoria sp. SIO1A7]